MCRSGTTRLAAVFLTMFPLSGVSLAASPREGKLESFIGPPVLEFTDLFERDRFPNVAVATDGTVLAFWNGVVVRRSEDGGRTWGPEIEVGAGFMGGGVTVDENSGDILAFVEAGHPPAALTVYRSRDHGLTWRAQDTAIHGNEAGHMPSMHMNEHGITLRHGEHRGRLIRPSRWYGEGNGREYWPTHYTNAVHSDDGGLTWQASEPFPLLGTGEACIVELSDGTLYYNSRRHWAPDPGEARDRWTARSADGGATWTDLVEVSVLPDGNRDTTYGLMGGLVRLPVQERDILIFSNIISDEGRKNGVVWASFDGGATWPIRRVVDAGGFAYSSLNAGRPGTAGEGWIYLLYETSGHPDSSGRLARFNLSWILAGEKTGDGDLPTWVFSAKTEPARAPDATGQARLTYTNPIIDVIGLADPHVLKHEGVYYLYPTHDSRGYDVYTSTDLVNWQKQGRCFEDPRGGVWAPDVFHHDSGDGRFYLYYTVGPLPAKQVGAIYGPGHHCVVEGPRGDLWMVYHQKADAEINWKRFLAIDPLRFDSQCRIQVTTTRGTAQPAP